MDPAEVEDLLMHLVKPVLLMDQTMLILTILGLTLTTTVVTTVDMVMSLL